MPKWILKHKKYLHALEDQSVSQSKAKIYNTIKFK